MPTPKKIEFQFLFHTPFAAGQVDRANGVIRGVSLITAGVKARGHELHTDEITLRQMEGCARTAGKIPVKLNHQSGIEKVCGYVDNVRREGVKLLGDWYLLKSHQEFEAMMERAERMPESFGLSAAFMGESELLDGRPMARCTELLAVDCVAQPAANPNGLFSRRVDTRGTGMDPNDPNAVPADMPAWFKPFADQLQSIAAQQKDISDYHAQLQQEAIAQRLLAMSPEERAALTAEELQQYGITREEVAEIDAIAAQMSEAEAAGGDANGNATGTEGATGATNNGTGTAAAGAARSGTVPAGSGLGNTSPAVAALQAEIAKLKQFAAGIQREKLNQLEAAQHAERELAITTLEEKTNALLVELDAKEEVIRRYEQAGVRVPASKEGVNLFSAKPGDGRSNQFQLLVASKLNELKAANPTAGAAQLKLLEARAVRETIRDHKQAYAEFRAGSVEVNQL